MANNRMYLRCRTCGNEIMLGKTYLDGYYNYTKNFENKLNEFYDKHNYCNIEPIENDYSDPKFISKNVDTENQFEIAYETLKD